MTGISCLPAPQGQRSLIQGWQQSLRQRKLMGKKPSFSHIPQSQGRGHDLPSTYNSELCTTQTPVCTWGKPHHSLRGHVTLLSHLLGIRWFLWVCLTSNTNDNHSRSQLPLLPPPWLWDEHPSSWFASWMNKPSYSQTIL